MCTNVKSFSKVQISKFIQKEKKKGKEIIFNLSILIQCVNLSIENIKVLFKSKNNKTEYNFNKHKSAQTQTYFFPTASFSISTSFQSSFCHTKKKKTEASKALMRMQCENRREGREKYLCIP